MLATDGPSTSSAARIAALNVVQQFHPPLLAASQDPFVMWMRMGSALPGSRRSVAAGAADGRMTATLFMAHPERR